MPVINDVHNSLSYALFFCYQVNISMYYIPAKHHYVNYSLLKSPSGLIIVIILTSYLQHFNW